MEKIIILLIFLSISLHAQESKIDTLYNNYLNHCDSLGIEIVTVKIDDVVYNYNYTCEFDELIQTLKELKEMWNEKTVEFGIKFMKEEEPSAEGFLKYLKKETK